MKLMRIAVLLLLILPSAFSAAQTASAPSTTFYDPTMQNAPKMPLALPELDTAKIDSFNDCNAAVIEKFKTLKSIKKARCAVSNTVAGCRKVIECDPTPEQVFEGPKKLKPAPGPGTTPAPGTDPEVTPSAQTKVDPSTPAATTPKKGGDDSTGGDGSSPASTTSSEEQSALQKCTQLASDADSACSDSNDDDPSYASMAGDGLAAACKDLQAAGASSAKSKADKSKACGDAFMACAQSCSSSADTYSESDNFSTFSSKNRACMALESKAKAMRDSSSSSSSASKSGTNCISDSSESPQSASDSKSASSSSKACTGSDCSASAMGGAAGAASAAAAPGTGGITDTARAKSNSGLDVGDTSGLRTVSNTGDPGQPSAAPRVSPIANNSGGGIPGSGGSANAGGAKSGGIMGAIKSTIADIEKGLFGGGGGSGTSAPAGTDTEGTLAINSVASPQAVADQRRAKARETDTLKRYLPGGDLWTPTRGPASVSQFHGPQVDLWSRITLRMQEKCKLGELYDCK